MTWSTFKERHAIERVRVSFQFKDILTSKVLAKINDTLDAHKSELLLNSSSDITVQTGIGFRPESPETPIPQTLYGKAFSKKIGGDIISEQLTIRPDMFIFETAEYVRWAQYLERLKTLLVDPLQQALEVSDIPIVQMEYWDRFVFDGEKEKAAPVIILKNIENQIPEASALGQMPWHLHRGWFETYENFLFLVNLNYASQDTIESDNKPSARSLSIYNKVEFREHNGSNLEHLTDDVLNRMHKLSKATFAKDLTDEAKGMLSL